MARSGETGWSGVIVVDTNIVVYALIASERTALARQLRKLDPVWRLPELWRHEYLNVLVTYVDGGNCGLDEARQLWVEANHLLADAVQPVDLSLAVRLAVEHRVSGYDAQFVALACALGAPLITEDRRLLKAFPGEAMSMQAFCRL